MDGLAARAVWCRGGDSGDGGGRRVFVLILWRLCDFPVVSSLLFCCQQSVDGYAVGGRSNSFGKLREKIHDLSGFQLQLKKFNESMFGKW